MQSESSQWPLVHTAHLDRGSPHQRCRFRIPPGAPCQMQGTGTPTLQYSSIPARHNTLGIRHNIFLYGYKRDTLIIAQYGIHAFSDARPKGQKWRTAQFGVGRGPIMRRQDMVCMSENRPRDINLGVVMGVRKRLPAPSDADICTLFIPDRVTSPPMTSRREGSGRSPRPRSARH